MKIPSPDNRPSRLVAATLAAVPVLLSCVPGCNTLSTIDRRTQESLAASAASVGEAATLPTYDPSKYVEGDAFPPRGNDQPETRNPPIEDLSVSKRDMAAETTEEIIDRFNRMVGVPEGATELTFEASFTYAQKNAAEYLDAEEAYIITALRLLIEEHRWGPNFFNETGATLNANADNSGRYQTAVTALNTLGVTQRLPYGGDVSARFIVAATEELDSAIDQSEQNADILLTANIPLLRGAGNVAQETLIQARRELIYSARDFQSFRRDFYFDLASDYLQLIFQRRQIANSEAQVQRSREVEERTFALFEAGRTEQFQADLARQNTLFAMDRLARLRETHRLAVDRYKLRIGMPTETPIEISAHAFDLPPIDAQLDSAVALAMEYRLDLQTEADRVEDARRRVDVAKNDLQGDLNVALLANMPTDADRVRSGLQFRPGLSDYTAAITYGLPLDRTTEEAVYRETQIRLEQRKRDLRTLTDQVAIEARAAVRGIEKAQFTLLISERNVETSNRRLESIQAAEDRATPRDRTEAVNNAQQAADNLESAKRDLQIAILGYLLSTGQMRINAAGELTTPPGMEQGTRPPAP
ncbi:MAG: TolC family protein [Phycisphaerae bacterium]|nr:TolC family protein [Phycisphaerae bacterium]